MYVFPDLFLGERNVLFNGLLDDEFQIALLCPLDSDKELIQLVVDEPVEVLDDVRMV
jgi:hypothetical protein